MKFSPVKMKAGQRRGAMLPLIAVTLVILIIGVVFSIDIAYMHMVRAELRTATDAAARAGAETLARTQDDGAAIASAIEVANRNFVAGTNLQIRADQVVIGSAKEAADGSFEFVAGRAPLTSVRVIGDRTADSAQGPVSMFFGHMLGQGTFQPTQVATASSSVRDIALVLDRSGSMSMPADGKQSRIEALVTAVNVFLAEIESSSPTSRISLTTYSTESTRDLKLTPNFASVRRQVNNLTPDGFTNINEALRDGSDSLIQDPKVRNYSEKTIIVMTDGRFNRGGNPVVAARLASDRGHTIHSITFSAAARQDVMGRVAEIGNGRHIHADDGDDLAEAFRTIAKTLSVTLVE